MKRRILSFFLLVCMVATLFSCTQEEPAQTPSPSVPVSLVPTIEATPTLSPTNEGPKSYTTGLPSDKEYKPMIVMIENSAASRPQTGLQQADVVYECMAEAGITRFACLFNDTIPVEVGPVRSARIYFINIQREWDAAFIHYGGPQDADKPSYVYGSKFDDIKIRIDGLKGAYSKYFWRSSKRSAPHNAYIDLTKVLDVYDYTPQYQNQFHFSDTISYEGQTVSSVGLPFVSNDSFVSFKYDASTDTFTRYNKGKVHNVTTVENGESKTAPLTVKNLIVQYAHTYVIPGDVSGRRNIDLFASGKCDYFVGGKHITGTWSRESKTSPTKYLLDDGSQLVLQPGNTWVAVHPDNNAVTINY